MAAEKLTKEKVLINKRIMIKPIQERFDGKYIKIDPKHVAKFRLPGCKFQFGLPLTSQGSLKVVLTSEEQEFFEELLGMKKGDLNFYRRGKNPNDSSTYNWWYGFLISLEEERTLTLDLSDPIQHLKYRVCTARPEIAPSYEARLDSGSYKYYMTEEKYEVANKVKYSNLKGIAYMELQKIRDNKMKMLDILKSLGKLYPNTVSEDTLIAQLTDIIETNDKAKSILSVEDFINAIKDKNTSSKALITDALSKRIILVKNKKYYYPTTDDLVAVNMEELLDWINNVENEEVKIAISKKLEIINNQ